MAFLVGGHYWLVVVFHPGLLGVAYLSFGCLLDVNLHHFSVTVPTSYRLKFTIIRGSFLELPKENLLDLELIWLLT